MRKMLLISGLLAIWGCSTQVGRANDSGMDPGDAGLSDTIKDSLPDSRIDRPDTGQEPMDELSEGKEDAVDANPGPDCGADGMIVLQGPCQAKFKCTNPDKYVPLTTVTCADMGLDSSCCQGVGCNEGQELQCPAGKVCTPNMVNATNAPCAFKPGMVIDAKKTLSMVIPQGTGELVFEATATAWYGDFSVAGREGAALRVEGPNTIPRYMVIPGGVENVPVHIVLGPSQPGTVTVSVDAGLSPSGDTPVWLTHARIQVLPPTDPLYEAYRHVPYFMGNAGRFISDLPLALTFNPTGGTGFDYTLFYSNEDSGYGLLPSLALAAWGRSVDIEWAANVSGSDQTTRNATFQTEDHGSKVFDGKWMGLHPVFYIANAHGTFSETGVGTVMFAPGPWKQPSARPREVFLDDRPWMVKTCNMELYREHKLRGSTPTVSKLQVPDLRQVLYLDMDASMAGYKLDLKLSLNGQTSMLNAGLGERAMMTDSGPKRIAMAFPADATIEALREYGVLQACLHGTGTGQAVLHKMTAFALDQEFRRVTPPLFTVDKDITLIPGTCVNLGQ